MLLTVNQDPALHDLSQFSVRDSVACDAELRKLGAGAGSMEEVASRIVRYFYANLIDGDTGRPACALVRLYRTVPFRDLNVMLRGFARGLLGPSSPDPAMKCLTLLGTAGEKPSWNSRKLSLNHQAIPLPSEEVVSQSPMIAQLVSQLGLDVSEVLAPTSGLIADVENRIYNVFYVAEAKGSPYVPAQQEFVVRHRIRSVLGLGGLLAPGDLYAVILFSKQPISKEIAALFRPLTLSVRAALLPFMDSEVLSN